MPEGESQAPVSTTQAVAAQAQSREYGAALAPAAEPVVRLEPGEGQHYTIAAGVTRAHRGRPYERSATDPIHRPLRIFTIDPTVPQLEGALAVVNVPYEPLGPDFKGCLFEIDARDGGNGRDYGTLHLDDRAVLLTQGHAPSPSDPFFHQQMVYAVCSLVYASFKSALGRQLAWGCAGCGPDETSIRLRLRPYAFVGKNAYYDKERSELAFGYFKAGGKVTGRNLPGGFVFTSLSHDVVAHEVTHALLDGLRAKFTIMTSPDVPAFHEGFADLVAILQHFSYDKVVEAAFGKARGRIGDATLLTDLARQFGQTIGQGQALRSAIDVTDPSPEREGKAPSVKRRVYAADLEAHQLGSVLVSAVFDAFMTIFNRKTARYIRLATNGTGQLPAGEISSELRSVLSQAASKLASQFLTMCIRAVDYCPPVDIELGEYLRAVITADRDLVPDDKWSYREAWIDAFRDREIYPPGVGFLAEDALLWQPPMKDIRPVSGLTFANLRFDGDPGRPAGPLELRRQAGVLGQIVSDPSYMDAFGLARPGDHRLRGDEVELPRVQSIRSSRRVGPDGQVVFDLVAEVTQVRRVRGRDGQPSFDFIGGATVIIGPDGVIRYTVSKNVLNEQRLERQREFTASGRGQQLWISESGRRVPSRRPFELLHHGRVLGPRERE
jgi:hypothetical protein